MRVNSSSNIPVICMTHASFPYVVASIYRYVCSELNTLMTVSTFWKQSELYRISIMSLWQLKVFCVAWCMSERSIDSSRLRSIKMTLQRGKSVLLIKVL